MHECTFAFFALRDETPFHPESHYPTRIISQSLRESESCVQKILLPPLSVSKLQINPIWRFLVLTGLPCQFFNPLPLQVEPII